MCFGGVEYDQELRRKFDFIGRFPGDKMTEKELADLKLWNDIRTYERLGMLRMEQRRLCEKLGVPFPKATFVKK